MRAWLAIWHAPGRMWAGMLRAGSLATWMQWGAGVSASLIVVAYMLIIWLGPWSAASELKRLELLGQGQLLAWLAVLVALAAIAGLRLAFSGGKDGFKGAVERDDDGAPAVAAKVTTDPTVETATPTPPAG